MLLSNYTFSVFALALIEILVRKWYRKNGGDYKKDKIEHITLSTVRGCVLLLFLYLSVISLYLGQKLSADIPKQGTTMYVYPDDDMKYNYFSSSFTDKYVGDPSEITEDTYFDKINLEISSRDLNLLDYLKNVIKAPFGLDYADFYEIRVEYVDNTGVFFIEEEAEVSEDTFRVGDIELRKNSYSNFLNNGDFVQAVLIYDLDSVNEGVIEKYVLAGGELND